MPKSYEYVRPKSTIGSRRKKSFLPQLLLLMVLLAIGFSAYYYFSLNQKEILQSKNQSIASFYLSTLNVFEKAVDFSYKGPSKNNEAVKQKDKALKNIFAIESFIKKAEGLTAEDLSILLYLVRINSELSFYLEIPFNSEIAKKSLPRILNELLQVRKNMLALALDERLKNLIEKNKPAFEESRVFKPKETQEILNKRRGLGIISYSIKPKFKGKDESGIYFLKEAGFFDLTIEVQNQGEVVEKNIKVVLNLETTESPEVINLEKIIDEIKPLEVKPVSFSQVPLTAPNNLKYTLTVKVEPVPSEKVLENNVLRLQFYVSP